MTFAATTPHILVPGLGIGGYRSMPDLRLFADLGKVTLLAGQNNVGKSNVVRFVDRYLRSSAPIRGWDDEPRPQGEQIRLATAHRLNETAYENWVGGHKARTDEFLALEPLRKSDDDLIWVVRSQDTERQRLSGKRDTVPWRLDPDWMQDIQDAAGGRMSLQRLRSGLFSTSGGGAEENVRAILDHLFPFEPPTVEVIHAFRRVDSTSAAANHSGGNLIATLADHQNPDVRERHKYEKFEQINRFLQVILEDPSVRIEIPANREYIAVHQGGMVLPLEDLGTGIHQAVIMAAAATLIDDSLVCVEEPEVNLHPVLQRKFVRYLSEETTNQYLIATHSAHMLDYERARVIHVRKDETGTIPSPATSTQQVAEVCADLGYRPSDILQSNAVIWVEGPSDRIYIKHWLRILEPENQFIEGTHYSIMFYGGSNRSHLTGDDPIDDPLDDDAANDLISLRRVNRNSAIVIDSDKSRAHGDRLDDNKIRVRDEFDRPDLPGHAWVTANRTIENYVPVDLLTEAVAAAHPRANYRPPSSKWDDPLHALRATGTRRAALNKVKVATKVVERWPPRHRAHKRPADRGSTPPRLHRRSQPQCTACGPERQDLGPLPVGAVT